MGTLDYCAPEQIRGEQVDARTDEYALACAAFMLLSGEPPFPRDEGLAVLYAHLSEPPPQLTSRRHDLPATVEARDDHAGAEKEFQDVLVARQRPLGPDTQIR